MVNKRSNVNNKLTPENTLSGNQAGLTLLYFSLDSDKEVQMRKTHIAITFASLFAVTSMATAKEVNVYNWYDYIAGDTIPNFEKSTGIKVRYETYDSYQMAETKIMTGNSGYDIIYYEGSSHKIAQHIKAGAYQKLDKSKLPNYKYLDQHSRKWIAAFDPQAEYGVPYLWGTTGIGYNPELVKKYAGDVPTDSWKLLFDPAIAKKLSQCGLTMMDDPMEAYGAVLSYLGKDPQEVSIENLKLVEEHLMKIRPYITYFDASQVITDLANGDTCVAHAYSGDVFISKDRAAEANNGNVPTYTIPKEGARVFFDAMYIPADAKNVDAALAFMNDMLDPKVAAANSNYVFFANPNTEAQQYVDPEVKNDPGIYPPEQVMNKLFTLPAYDNKFGRKLLRMWSKFKAG